MEKYFKTLKLLTFTHFDCWNPSELERQRLNLVARKSETLTKPVQK